MFLSLSTQYDNSTYLVVAVEELSTRSNWAKAFTRSDSCDSMCARDDLTLNKNLNFLVKRIKSMYMHLTIVLNNLTKHVSKTS